MASVTIQPTNCSDSTFWSVQNAGNPITAITDSDGGTFVYNVYPHAYVSSFRVYSSAAPPSNFAGATINSVTVSHGANSGGRNGCGTLTTYVLLNGNTTTAGSIDGNNGGAAGASYSVARPGGGSWTSSDFFSSNLQWQLSGLGDAWDVTRNVTNNYFYLTVNYTPVTAPVGAFTVSTTTGTAPLSVTFTDQGTNTPTSWSWAFGDTSTSIIQNPVHVYTVPGTYTVTLTESNAGGSTSISTGSLINVQTAATSVSAAFIGAPTSGVQNLSVRFTDQSTGTPVASSWYWQFGDTSTSTSQNPTHIYTTEGTYTVTLTASNTTPTTSTTTRTNYIVVADGKPIPSFKVSTTTGERPLTVTFTGTATNAAVTQWFWEFGDGVTSSAQNPTHVYNSAGNYSPTLQVTNAIGSHTTNVFVLRDEATTRTNITALFKTIVATFTGQPLMGYIPLTVRFTDDSNGDAFSWFWDFGDGSTGIGENPVHTYTVSTLEGGVQVTVTDTAYNDPASLRNDLYSYWKMEETTGTASRADFIDSLPLAVINTVTQTTGKNDFGALVVGGNQIRKVTGFPFSSSWSFSGWFNFPTSTISSPIIELSRDTLPSTDLQTDASGKLVLLHSTQSATGSTALTAGVWYHIALVWDSSASLYSMYLNGVLEGTVSGTAVGGSRFQIPPSNDLIVDELGYYSSAIGPFQVSELYNSGAGLFFNAVATNTSTFAPNLICPISPDHTWGYFFEELKYQMMEPLWNLNPCLGFQDFGGMTKAVDFTFQRLTRFILETGLLRKTAAVSNVGADVWELPTDFIELLLVIDSTGSRLHSVDKYQQDREESSNVYLRTEPHQIQIPGSTSGNSFNISYSYLPSKPTVPDCTTCPTNSTIWPSFPLPYALWWIIRYGVMADLLNQAGPRNDPSRAVRLEELFNTGIELYKLLYRGFDGGPSMLKEKGQ